MDLHVNWMLPKQGGLVVSRKSLQEYDMISLWEEKETTFTLSTIHQPHEELIMNVALDSGRC